MQTAMQIVLNLLAAYQMQGTLGVLMHVASAVFAKVVARKS